MNPIARINSKIEEASAEIDRLKNLKAELEQQKEALLSLPEQCPSCSGTGMERYTDAAGDTDTRECLTCKGLGRIGSLQCANCGREITTDMIALRRKTHPECPWCGCRQLVLKKEI